MVRFNKLTQEFGITLDLALQLRVKNFSIHKKLKDSYHENNKIIKTIVNVDLENDTLINRDTRLARSMIVELWGFQESRHRTIENIGESFNLSEVLPDRREEAILASLAKHKENSPNFSRELTSIVFKYLKNHHSYLKSYANFVKKHSFLLTSLYKLRDHEGELSQLTTKYQDSVSAHLQKNRDELINKLERDSFIILVMVLLSVVLVAVVIWLVSSRGIVSRLNYLIDVILSDHKKIIPVAKKNVDEIGKLSEALRNLIADQRQLKFSNEVLRGVARAENIKELLNKIILWYESENRGSCCAVLLLDEEKKHLSVGASPSLPSAYNQAMDGITVEPAEGPCGSAAYSNSLVVVEDILADPFWQNYKDVVTKGDLRACWSHPIVNFNGIVIGVFVIYSTVSRKPTDDELDIIKILANKMGFAIESIGQGNALKESEGKYRKLFQQLRSIVEGTSSRSSKEYFKMLTKYLAHSLDVRYAFIGKLVAETDVETLAVWANEDFAENFTYSLKNTPCENLVGQTLCCYPKGVQEAFPKDDLLKEMAVESYLGLPLFDSAHKPMGVLSVMHNNPILNQENAKIIMSIFASQAESEMERKADEKRLKTSAKELERSNKELEVFTSIASHDLSEPLRKIITFGERLKEETGDLSERGSDCIERMQKASRRMQLLIDDLLKLSKVNAKRFQFKTVNMNKIVKEVTGDLEARIVETKAVVSYENLPTIQADPLQIRQLFQNLIGNSLKYHKDSVPPEVHVEYEKTGDGFLKISVKDNGIGFDEKYTKKIFLPFERLHGKSAYEGTGMGLAICKKIVDRHNGTITVKSTLGLGSTFIVTFPT